jgi:hypothetical protein
LDDTIQRYRNRSSSGTSCRLAQSKTLALKAKMDRSRSIKDIGWDVSKMADAMATKVDHHEEVFSVHKRHDNLMSER